MNRQLVLVLDFGGQYNQLIARRVRDLNVYCEMVSHNISKERIKEKDPIGIILTGGPHNSFEEGAPLPNREIFDLGIPVLGICYGSQVIAQFFGGKVGTGPREYGKITLKTHESELFGGVPKESICYMSHSNYIERVPEGFRINCYTDTCPAAGIENKEKNVYGLQYHPEVLHSEYGTKVLENFLYKICGARGDWTMSDFAKDSVQKIKAKVGNGKALCALSGGVDSAVAAALMHKACPDLVCIFVDHGMLRKGEADQVMRVFKDEQKINIIKVDAKERFLKLLEGVKDPEKKRKIIGAEFIRVFEEEARKIGKVDYLVQGTIYPDVIESGVGISAVIKTHHNVGGLPDVIDFKEIIEPLRDLFKDEVRKCGLELGLPEDIVMRQPFPGPGLAIRIIGEITFEKLEILRDADFILREEIEKAGLSRNIWQYFVVLTDIRSVGVMGDERTYDYLAVVRAVTAVDGMTAEWARIPYDVLERVSLRIVNEVRRINRVAYDITGKPPATIEWE